MTKVSKAKIRSGLFAGVFGLVCMLITLFVGYTFTISLPPMLDIAMSIVGILTMWMVFVAAYICLTILEMANAQA